MMQYAASRVLSSEGVTLSVVVRSRFFFIVPPVSNIVFVKQSNEA